MDAYVYIICNYLNNKYLETQKTVDIDAIKEELESLRTAYRLLNDAYKDHFNGINLETTDFFKSVIFESLTDLSEDRLRSDALLINFRPNSELSQYKNAHDDIKGYLSALRYEIKECKNKITELEHSQANEKFEKILKIFKSGEGAQIKVSGNINREEYEYLIELLEESTLPLETINNFLFELNDAIAAFKLKVNKLNAVIEREARKEELKNLTQPGLHKLQPEATASLLRGETPKKVPEYNNKRIFKLIENLKSMYSGVVENPTITSETPFNKTRTRLYYTPDAEGKLNFDLNIALYDLINFINPTIIDERFAKGEIKPIELDFIRNKLYKEILKRYETLVPGTSLEEPEEEEEQPVIPTAEKILESLEQKEEEKPAYRNEKVKPLSDEEKAKIEYAKKVVHELRQSFKDMLKYPRELLRQCFENNDTNGYDFDLEMLSLELESIPSFENKLVSYRQLYNELLTDPALDDEDYLDILAEEQDDLSKAASYLIDKFEIYQMDKEEEIEEFSPNINNIVVLYSAYSTGETPITQDVQDIKATGQVDENLIYDGLGRLEFINTITNGPNVKKIAGTKHNLDELKIYRYRQGSLRYLYLDITLEDSNKEVIKEKYGLTTDNLRLLLVPYIFYKRGDNKAYDVGLSRVESIKGIDENQVDSILWIKKIFGNKFTEESKKIAFEIIDSSIAIRNSISKGDDGFGSY